MRALSLSRRLIVLSTLVWLAAVATVARAGETAKPARPNILWITCEDISPHLGCYGDPLAITPHLDRLASEGVRYANAFSIAGVCAPSRSCIITGMYPTSIGSQHMRSRAVLPESIRCFTEHLREAGYYCTNNVKTDYNFAHPQSAWDESSRKAHWKNRQPGQPFFAVFNITVTHESRVRADDAAHAKNTAPLTASQRQDPGALELPPYYPDTPSVRKDWAHYYELITAMDHRVGQLLQELQAAGLDDETVVFYYADHGVGLPRAKRWLYDSGIRVPMIVRWPGKLAPGRVEQRLVSFVDLAPTVFSIAGVEIPERFQGRAFLGENQAELREYIFAARDRMDERYDLIRAVRDRRYKYIRNYDPQAPYARYLNYAEVGPTMQEIRRLHAAGELVGPQKLFMRPTKPIEELYDLEEDPHELNNLAGSAGQREILTRMRAAHLEWSERTLDSGLLPEPELENRAGRAGIYAVLRASDHGPFLRRLRRLAMLSAEGNEEALPQLLEAFSATEPALRYWAVIGLSRFAGEKQAAAAALTKGLRDPSPSVRIAAARGLCAAGGEEAGLPVLAAALAHQQNSVRILAAHAIDTYAPFQGTNDQRRTLLPKLEAAMQDKTGYVVRIVNHTLNELNGTSNRVR